MAESRVKITLGSEANLTGFEKVKGALARMASKVKSFASTVGSNLMNIKAGFDMLRGAVHSLFGVFKKAFDAETMTMQFKTLLGSMEAAQQHMAMLQKMGDTPPFSMEEFAAASRAMMVFSDGVLGAQDSLELVGDAAAATGKPLEQVSEAVARAYGMIRDGQPISRMVVQLRNLGLITPEVAAELNDMQKTGASNVEIWNKLQDALGKFSGAMADTENTVNGRLGALQSAWDDAAREMGASVAQYLVEPLKKLADMLHDLRESGDLKSWAETSVDAVKYVLSFLQPIYTAAKGLVAVFGTMLAGAAALDESGKNGEGWFNFSKAADVAQRFWDDFWDNDKDSAEKAQEAVWDGEEKKRRQAEREQQEALRRQAEREQQKNALIAAEKKRLEQRAAAEEEAEIKRQAKLEQELYESEYENMEEQARLEAQESIDQKAKAEEDRLKKEQKKKTDALKKAANAEKKAAKDAHNLKMKQLDKEIDKLKEFAKAYDEAMRQGMQYDNEHNNGGYAYSVDRNGNPDNVADAEHAERQRQRDERGKGHRRQQDDRREQRILNDAARQINKIGGLKNGELSNQQIDTLVNKGVLTKEQGNFLRRRNQMRERARNEAKIKDLQKQKDEAVLDISRRVAKIETNLEKALSIK